ncbi:type II secretion system F family protein [bacterium]|nr:type II secretion system F family protein [bacterium]
MTMYNFKAIDQKGIEISGEIEASGEMHIVNKLAARGYSPSFIKEKRKKIFTSFLDAIGYGVKINNKDILLFTRQMASLIAAGIPITSALRLLAKQGSSNKIADLTNDIRESIEDGNTFSDALEKKIKIFGDSYLSMVKAGEESGDLPGVFKRLAELMEVESQRRSDIKSAISYPIVLILAAIGGAFFLIVGVFPTFTKIFSKANVSLPLTTKTMLALGKFMTAYYPFIIVGVLASFIFLYFYIRTESGKRKIDFLKIKAPIFGDLFMKSSLSRFAHNYMALNTSGIPVYRTLEIVSGSVNNLVIGGAILAAREKIKEGKTIAKAFEMAKRFPPFVVHMLSIGEESGKMDEMLEKIYEYYDNEVAYSISKLTKMIEPLLIAVMGVIVTFMYLSLVTPMMQMMKVVKGGGLG